MSHPFNSLDWQPFELEAVSKKKFSLKCLVHLLAYNRADAAKVKSLMFLTTDDKVYSFGANKNGCLAFPVSSPEARVVKQIDELSNKKIAKLVAGNAFGLALLRNGRLLAWGLNQLGQLGIGQTRTSSIAKPTEVAELGEHVIVEVQCGACHVLALTSRAYLFAWGANTSGAVGNGTLRHCFKPTCLTRISAGQQPQQQQLGAVLAIAAGGWQSAAIDFTGALHFWGTQSSNSEPISTPRWVKLYDHDKHLQVKSVTCGRTHVMAITFDNLVIVFGDNEHQQCLPNFGEARAAPIASKFSLDHVQVVSFVERPSRVQAFPNFDISMVITDQCYHVWGVYDKFWLQRLIKVNRLPPNFDKVAPDTNLLTCRAHFTASMLNFDVGYLERRAKEYIVLVVDAKIKGYFHLNMFNDPNNADICFQLEHDHSIYLTRHILKSYGERILQLLANNNFFAEVLPKTGRVQRFRVLEPLDSTFLAQYLVSLHTGQMLIREGDLVRLMQFGEQLSLPSILEACHAYIRGVDNAQLLSNWYNQACTTFRLAKETIQPIVDHFYDLLDAPEVGQEIRRELFALSARQTGGATLFDVPFHRIMLPVMDLDEQDILAHTTRDIFSQYLGCVYNGPEASFIDDCSSLDLVGDIYLLATRFHNAQLQAKCLAILRGSLSVANCCRLYASAKLINNTQLVSDCLAFAKSHLVELIESCEFRRMMLNNEKIFKEFMLDLNNHQSRNLQCH